MPTGLAGIAGAGRGCPLRAAAKLARVGAAFAVAPGEESSSNKAAVANAVLLGFTGSAASSDGSAIAGTDCDTAGGENESPNPLALPALATSGLTPVGTCHSACSLDGSAPDAFPGRPRLIGETSAVSICRAAGAACCVSIMEPKPEAGRETGRLGRAGETEPPTVPGVRPADSNFCDGEVCCNLRLAMPSWTRGRNAYIARIGWHTSQPTHFFMHLPCGRTLTLRLHEYAGDKTPDV